MKTALERLEENLEASLRRISALPNVTDAKSVRVKIGIFKYKGAEYRVGNGPRLYLLGDVPKGKRAQSKTCYTREGARVPMFVEYV